MRALRLLAIALLATTFGHGCRHECTVVNSAQEEIRVLAVSTRSDPGTVFRAIPAQSMVTLRFSPRASEDCFAVAGSFASGRAIKADCEAYIMTGCSGTGRQTLWIRPDGTVVGH